jgi:hypothetical protein
MRKVVSILLYLCLLSSVVSAQDVKVTAGFDTSRIIIGDQTYFTVTVEKPVSYRLEIPLFRDSLQKNLQILRGPSIDTSLLKDGRMRTIHKYLITSFDSGKYQLPPVYAELKEANGIKRFYSDYSQLEVMRVRITPPDTVSKIFDIVKPYKAPLTAGEILPWVMLAGVVAAGIWYLIRYIKKIRRKEAGIMPEPEPEAAHVIAFRQLEQLKNEKLFENGELKAYYTRLTEIARLYLENRYNICSLELTTVETLAELRKAGFKEDEHFRKIRTVLTGADLVKFAKFKPEASENELQYNYIWEFVDGTRLVIPTGQMKEEVESNQVEK